MEPMKPRELCLQLMRADTEEEVVSILTEAGYWQEPRSWRYLGGIDNNFSSIGNQQSEAIAALVEKIVNGVDSRLINACFEAGTDPTSAAAPESIREAVAKFYEERPGIDSERAGRIAEWDDIQTTAEGRLLTVAVTGHKPENGWPSITIADQGEGQTPDSFPDTFMSLHRSNKLRIPFVQGKFNMGGTGALSFTGREHRVQLVVSRRNPRLLSADHSDRDEEWGFTIVRREPPAGSVRSSVFTYLAPVGVNEPRRGSVLSFKADGWPIFPEITRDSKDAYSREAAHGALVKLYEYTWSGTKSNVIWSGGGLLRRLDQALPELALPVRLYECRAYKGHAGSFETNVLGLTARLERDRAEKLEPGFPVTSVIDLDGAKVRTQVFAFKKDQAADYRTHKNAVIFAVNGQTHATQTADFFRRKSVKKSYLADSLLVSVDCSSIDGQQREDLFMNSRDRLRDTPISERLLAELEEFLHTNQQLRDLQNRRREENLKEKLDDSQPLASALEDLMKQSPTLSKLFLKGLNITSPFPPKDGTGEGDKGTFEGKPYPTYFRFAGKGDREHLRRDAYLNVRSRVAFETDAQEDYFLRDLDRGTWEVLLISPDGTGTSLPNCRMDGPSEGVANLKLELPSDVVVGEKLDLLVSVTDPSRVEPFENHLELDIRAQRNSTPGGTGGRKNRNRGKGSKGTSASLALPNIKRVAEEQWAELSDIHTWTEDSALVIVSAEGEEDASVYDFYVNVDNKYLRSAQKEGREDPRLLEKKFTYSLVLMGLALIQDRSDESVQGSDGDERASEEAESTERFVSRVSEALSIVALPLLEVLSGLELDELP